MNVVEHDRVMGWREARPLGSEDRHDLVVGKPKLAETPSPPQTHTFICYQLPKATPHFWNILHKTENILTTLAVSQAPDWAGHKGPYPSLCSNWLNKWVTIQTITSEASYDSYKTKTTRENVRPQWLDFLPSTASLPWKR